MPNNVEVGGITILNSSSPSTGIQFQASQSPTWLESSIGLLLGSGLDLNIKIILKNETESVVEDVVVRFYEGTADAYGDNHGMTQALIHQETILTIQEGEEEEVIGLWPQPGPVDWHSVFIEVSHGGYTDSVSRSFQVVPVTQTVGLSGTSGTDIGTTVDLGGGGVTVEPGGTDTEPGGGTNVVGGPGSGLDLDVELNEDEEIVHGDDEEITVKEGEAPLLDYSGYWKEISAHVEALMNSAITPGVEGETLSWLARRRVLKGIPFQYLVPTEDALPPETIRFFHIDRNWLDALIDGCLSVALTTSRERKWLLEEREDPWASAQQGPHPIPSQVSDMCFEDFDINGDGVLNVLDIAGWINAGETQGSPIIDKLQQIILGSIPTPPPRPAPTITNYEYIMRKLNSLEMWYRGMFYNALYHQNSSGQADFTTGGRLTGMLFRSTIVRDFPGLEISAFAEDDSGDPWTAENLVQIIRMERLSESIMLCIFNGLPTHLRIQEPSEGIRMGVDPAQQPGGPLRLKMKGPDGSLFAGSPSVDADLRDSEILDIQRIYDNLMNDTTVSPQIHSQFASDSVSAFFATQLLQFPYQQDFVPLPDVGPQHPDINFPRGVLNK